jgi:hypothetical protein
MQIFSRLSNLFSDGIKQEQPQNTYSDAIGYTGIKGSEAAGYVTSSTGNIKWIGLPAGFEIRGEKYLPEYDQWIFMGIAGGQGEIGVADHRTKKYTTLVTDAQLDRPLGLQSCVWTRVEVNVHANCNRIKVYFQTNRIYRVVELYDPCCNFDNTLLMKPTCISSLRVEAIKGIGQLVNGSYRASIKVFDKDLNDTNFAQISQPVTVADGDYRIDEVTTYGLVIEGFNMPVDYNMAELVIIENITGANAYKVLNNVGFGEGYFHYMYTGAEGYYADGKLSDILNRKQQYFRGDGIAEHDNALMLFNVEPQRNYNLQKIVNGFRVGYKRWLVPTKYAKDYKGLRENENYEFCIWYNGKDGTRTIAYPFINHLYGGNGTVGPGGDGNCQNCDVPVWATTDTSQQTRLFIVDACGINRAFKKTYSNRLNRRRSYERNPRSKNESNENTKSKTDRSRRGGGGVGPRSNDNQNNQEENGAELNNDVQLQLTETQELCDLTSPCLSTFNIVYNEIKAAFYILINSVREGLGLPVIEFTNTATPDCVCSLAASVENYLQEKNQPMLDESSAKNRTRYDSTRHIPTNFDCTVEGEIRCGGTQVCYECKGGKWNYINNSIQYRNRPVPLTVSGNKEATINRNPIGVSLDFSGAQNSFGSGGILDNNPWGNNCLNDIGQPIAYSEGNFGYWETNARYPETIGRDDCEPIFGEYAGQNQRLYKVPSLGKEPHFLSFADGVPSKQNIGNDELQDSYVIFTAPRFYNISIPEVIQDWVCQKNPFTIGYAERDESNKTVISTGILHGTMAANIQGDEYLIAKHAVNSFEFVDQSINPGGTNTLRIGSSSPIPAYIYHSPDYHLYGNYLNGHYALFQMELDGAGYRHGLYADGEKPDTPYQPKYNQGGARQGVNLNHFICKPNPIFRCIKGMADAPANSIVGKDAGSNFTRSLVNLFRESAQYIEFLGSKVGFTQDANGPYNSLNGGDGESDNSFTGDTINHETFIDNARAHLITVMRYLPNQYGPVISRAYIPIGLNATYATGQMPKDNISIEGLVGDSFIGPFNYKRSGFVSDKVPENISPVATFGIFENVRGGNIITNVIRNFFKDMLENIVRVLGWEEIGTTPDNGDPDDDRNWFGGLRNEWFGYESSTAGPTSRTTTPEFPDTYFPHMVKTYISSFLTSDANLNYRGAGTILFGDDGVAEVYRTKLKTLNLDSTMPDGENIFRAWLNRIAFLMKEPSRWKMILRLVINFLWTYGIGIYIMLLGVKLFYLSWPLAGGYIVSATGTMALIGAGIKLIASAFIIYLGSLWISIWANLDFHKKIIDNMLGIEWAHPDKTFREANEAGQGTRWGMFPARCKDFEDNYWYYNPTFTQVNEGEICFGMPFYYDTEYCPDKFTNRIIASNMQNPSSEIDAWRQFKPNHYIDIPRNRGKITILFSNQGQLYAQTTDTTFQISYNGSITGQMTNEELLLGRMYLFGRSQDVYGAVMEGWAGNKDPNAAKETAMGFFFFDRDARRLKVFGNSDIPFSGIEEFMDDNLKFHILDYFPDYPIQDQKCKSGVHFDFAIDHGNSKLYIYKKDFIPKAGVTYTDGKLQNSDGGAVTLGDSQYFTDKSFVYEYCMRARAWKSRHYWRPELLLFNRYNMFDVKDGFVWSFDTKSIFNNFHGEQFPAYIEIPILDYGPQAHTTCILKNIKIIGELIEVGDSGVEKEIDEPLYDMYQIWNGRQNSGWISIREISTSDDDNLINDINETDEAKWTRKGNGTIIQEFKNNLADNSTAISTYNKKYDIMDVGSLTKKDNGVFEDDFVVLRLMSFKKANQKIHLRKLLLTFNVEQDG